jgi:DNA polymerase-3 subunit delta'
MADAAQNIAEALPWAPLLPWQFEAARAMLGQRARWPHAMLIHGARGLGKHALALNLAQGLLCEAPRPDGLACGGCPGCRYASAGQHPDLMRLELLEVDAEEGGLAAVNEIRIERVRALIEFAQLTSHRQQAKVAVIAPAERMKAPAANALLKTLEEPPTGTYLILVSDQPGCLPPTIVSRCVRVAAPRPAPAVALAWLAEQGVAAAAVALAQAGGSPLLALQHADPVLAAERRTWLAALAEPDRLAAFELAARIDVKDRNERKARLAQAIDWLLAWTTDLARAPARLNPDAAAALASVAPRVAPLPLFRYHRRVLAQRGVLAHPLAPRLVAEALLIDYLALFG